MVTQAFALALIFPHAMIRAQNVLVAPGSASAATYKVSGTIVSALDGAPLGLARVSLADAKNRDQSVWVITSENGHFEFSSIPAGKFSLEGAKKGFLSATYQQHEQFSTAIVTGAGLNTENLTLRLTPLSMLSGKIVDESGDPVRTARVMVYVESHNAGVNRIRPACYDVTDDQGYYECPALAPGNYYVSVTTKPWYAVHPSSTYIDGVGSTPPGVARSLDVAYPTTFYNGATDSDGATLIPIHGNERVTADVHLSPVPALHLFVRDPTEDRSGFRMPIIQKRIFDSQEFVQAEETNTMAPGVYEIMGVPPGKYMVGSRTGTTGRLAQSSEMNLSKDGQEVASPSNDPSGEVKVLVKMARGEPIPQELRLVLRNAGGQSAAFKPIGSNGDVIFEDVAPGKYSILVNSPTPHTIARITSQGIETAGHDIDVTAGSSMDLSVFVVAGIVGVEGFAKRAGQPMSGVMIALVPRDPQSHPERFRRDQSNMDGSFALPAVLPGSYTIIAVEDAWGFPWMQPGALDRYVQHGQNITIGELMKGSVLLPDPLEVQPR
jgi:hypothetical protein